MTAVKKARSPKVAHASGSAIDQVDTTYLQTLMGYNARRAALSIIELFLERLAPYGGQERRQVSEGIPGAIFKLTLDITHPLAYGMSPEYFSLKTGAQAYQHLKNVWNVGTISDQLMVSGFAGAEARKAQKNTTVFAVESKGSGSAIYLVDNPLFRAFWENGKFLFSNALFFAGF